MLSDQNTRASFLPIPELRIIPPYYSSISSLLIIIVFVILLTAVLQLSLIEGGKFNLMLLRSIILFNQEPT